VNAERKAQPQNRKFNHVIATESDPTLAGSPARCECDCTPNAEPTVRPRHEVSETDEAWGLQSISRGCQRRLDSLRRMARSSFGVAVIGNPRTVGPPSIVNRPMLLMSWCYGTTKRSTWKDHAELKDGVLRVSLPNPQRSTAPDYRQLSGRALAIGQSSPAVFANCLLRCCRAECA